MARSDGVVAKKGRRGAVPFPTHTNSLRATNGRPYETLAVLQYKTTQKGDQRPPYEIFII